MVVKQLDIFAIIDNAEEEREFDPCDRCTKNICFGCPYAEDD